VFKTIIVQTFHEALDVMFATARSESDVKVLSPAAGRILTNSSFVVSKQVYRATSAGEKLGCTKRKRIVSELSATLPQLNTQLKDSGSMPMRSYDGCSNPLFAGQVAFGRLHRKRAAKEIGSAPFAVCESLENDHDFISTR